jgi:hypothetical protein
MKARVPEISLACGRKHDELEPGLQDPHSGTGYLPTHKNLLVVKPSSTTGRLDAPISKVQDAKVDCQRLVLRVSPEFRIPTFVGSTTNAQANSIRLYSLLRDSIRDIYAHSAADDG